MTDEEFVLKEDIKAKASAAKGAFHKSRGGKYMRTPSDYLTKKELKEMNGEPITYRIAPMTWDEFQKIPTDIQKEYIETLFTRFGVSIYNMAKMFGVSFKTLSHLANSIGAKKKDLKKEFDEKAWNEWLIAKKETVSVPQKDDILTIVPMTYPDLKNHPVEFRAKYIEYLRKRFGLSASDMSKYWGVTASTIGNQFVHWHVDTDRKKLGKKDIPGYEAWLKEGGIDIPAPSNEPAISEIAEELNKAIETVNEDLCKNSESDLFNDISRVVPNNDEEKPIAGRFKWGENDIPEPDEFEQLGRFLKYVKSIGGSVSINISI